MRRIFWLLLLCGAVCSAQTSTGGGQSGTGGGGGGGCPGTCVLSINADTTAAQTLVSGTGISISNGGGGAHTITNTGVTSAPGSLHDLICTGGSSNFVACSTGAAYYSSGILTVPQIAVSGTTPAAIEWVAGTGNIPALTANGAGFAAPTTGGTAFLIKWPGTGAAGVWQSAACATGDNVNECALSFSTALANGTTATTQTSTDNTTKLATDAFVQTVVSASSGPASGTPIYPGCEGYGANANWNGDSGWGLISGGWLSSLPSSWKVVWGFSGGTGVSINKAFVLRTLRGSFTVIDSTQIKFSGTNSYDAAFGYAASQTQLAYVTSDAIALQTDSAHDYWIMAYFDNDGVYNGSVAFPTGCIGIGTGGDAAGDETGVSTIPGSGYYGSIFLLAGALVP